MVRQCRLCKTRSKNLGERETLGRLFQKAPHTRPARKTPNVITRDTKCKTYFSESLRLTCGALQPNFPILLILSVIPIFHVCCISSRNLSSVAYCTIFVHDYLRNWVGYSVFEHRCFCHARTMYSSIRSTRRTAPQEPCMQLHFHARQEVETINLSDEMGTIQQECLN